MNLYSILMSVIPSIALLILFWYIMRGIIRADRREREALAALDREEAEKARRALKAHGDASNEDNAR